MKRLIFLELFSFRNARQDRPVARCTFFRIPSTWEELLLVSGTEALANKARLLNLVEQGHGIIFG